MVGARAASNQTARKGSMALLSKKGKLTYSRANDRLQENDRLTTVDQNVHIITCLLKLLSK